VTALLETIRAYQQGLDDFNKNSPRDQEGSEAYIDVSYGPPLALLDNWDKPAETREEAIEALRISLTDKNGVYGSDAADRMVEAAIGYLEGIGNAEDQAPPSLYRLMSIYWDRFNDVCKAMAKTDQFDFDTPEREAAFEAQGAAGDRLAKVACAICAFVPHNRIEARIKAQFLKEMAAGNGGRLYEEEQDALLSSLPDLVYYKEQEALS
jgi:hypothetical protein